MDVGGEVRVVEEMVWAEVGGCGERDSEGEGGREEREPGE